MRKNKESESTIRRLVEKYYEGLTDRVEEKEIADFLMKNPKVKGFEVERALFAYFDKQKDKPKFRLGRYWQKISVAAAVVAILITSGNYFAQQDKTQNYAYLNGKKITKEKQIRSLTDASLSVFANCESLTEDVFEPFRDNEEMIEQQLELFSEVAI